MSHFPLARRFMPKRQIQENRRMFPYLFIHRVVSSMVHCPHGFPAMNRFLEGSRSASKPASAPRPLPSCHPSHPAKVSGGFLSQTLPAVLHRNFQKRPVRIAGTVFHAGIGKHISHLCLPLLEKGGKDEKVDARQKSAKRKKKRISSNKAIHPHTGRHRFLLTISIH